MQKHAPGVRERRRAGAGVLCFGLMTFYANLCPGLGVFVWSDA